LPLDPTDAVTFVGDARENPGSVQFSLILRTCRLLPNAYHTSGRSLSDKVIELRDFHKMTFRAIAYLLQREGAIGARGAPLCDRGVFSVYTKRRAYDERRSAPVRFDIREISVLPPG
jgi:hypothetical protein